MTNASAPWWEVIALRDEVTSSGGAIDDVQMSLHDAVFGKEGVGAGLTPYSDAAYFGSITHPTGNLVELMARVAVRLGVHRSTQTSAMWRLDQAMGGGKSHGLIGLWHLAAHPEELAQTDLGRAVMAAAESIAGPGEVRSDLGNPICVVLDCDNTTADAEDFGPASRLGERFLWRLFDKDGHRYDAFKDHITNKAKVAEALSSVDRPVLILIDEIMDYIRAVAASDPDGSVLDMAFLRVLLDVVNDVPNCAAVVVMIASDKDNMVMSDTGAGHRAEMEDLLTRNARTTAVTGGGDFAEIIQRRLVADDKTQANLREVAGVDIIDQHNPERGAARRLDTLRDEGWSHHNPRAAERMATALFVRSLCPRANGARGAPESELLAASFVPGGGYGTGDAEAVAAELLETDEGVASVELLPGRGSAPRRWVFETRKTLAMLTRAEKKTVSNADRDKAVTDRAFEIASSGPFDRIVQVDGGDVPQGGVTTAGCVGVLEQAGIDNKHQTRLVILDSRWFSLLNGNDSATREAIAAALGTGPNPMAVQWASSAVFACANTAVRGQARGLAAEWLARERVAVLPAVQADREMKRRAREEAKEAMKRLDKMVQQCYRHIVYLAPKDEFNRVMAFRRMRRDTQSALSGADVWDELRDARKAFRLGEFDHNVLLHNLRDNDEGRPLPEIRDSFWSNPHKPLLPSGASELRDAIYAAIRSSDLELVSPNGEIYEVQTSGDITLSSHHIRLRRAVCSTPGTPPPPPPPPPRPPDPEPDGKTRHWQITLSINTTLDPDAPHDELVHLLRVVTNHIDDGRVRHINQATQFTIRAEIDDKETITALAEEARASINIIPL